MAINWKYETAADQARRFWQSIKERCYQEGLMALPDTRCPYPGTSFAGQHWRRGQIEREGDRYGNDTRSQD